MIPRTTILLCVGCMFAHSFNSYLWVVPIKKKKGGTWNRGFILSIVLCNLLIMYKEVKNKNDTLGILLVPLLRVRS